jgi:hypothetical protein
VGWGAAAASIAIASSIGAACATGASSTDETEEDIEEGGGGAGGTASTAGGFGGMPTTGGMGGEGGMELPCTEDPCKVVAPQCGCPEAQKCTMLAGMRTCRPAGSTPIGGTCASDTDCEAGTMCVGLGGLFTCHEFCAADPECAPPGGLCAIDLGAGPEALCTENCDPISGSGCTLSGSKCELFNHAMGFWYSGCMLAGAGIQGTACNNSDECGPGLGCLTVASVTSCHQWCNVNAPVCPVQAPTCANFDPPLVIGAVTYGGCL